MRKNITYVAVILALAAIAASCNKVEDKTSANDLISFEPQVAGTKAMINDEAGLQAQTFEVKDFLDGALYVDNVIAYNGGWAYTSPADAKYLWKNGAHKLFGYTAGMGTFSGSTLSIPAQTITTAYTQKDLLYSDIVSTTADAWKASGKAKGDPVPLHFHHLFSALSITLENFTPADVVVNSVSVVLPNQAAPEISFAGDVPAMNVGTLTKGEFIAAPMSAAVTLASKEFFDVLAQAKLAEAAVPLQCMVWPQTLAAASETAGAQIVISYVQDGVSKTATVAIPAGTTWVAGKVNAYNLEIRPTEVTLVFEVQPWQSVDNIDKIDTSTGSINMSNVTWVQQFVNGVNTVINGKHGSVTMLIDNDGAYTPAKGYFTVNYPTAGTYEITLIPADGGTEADLAYFTVSPSGAQTLPIKDGIPQTIYFNVAAASTQDGKEHKAQIDITITPQGSNPVSAYSEIRATYTLIIPAK